MRAGRRALQKAMFDYSLPPPTPPCIISEELKRSSSVWARKGPRHLVDTREGGAFKLIHSQAGRKVGSMLGMRTSGFIHLPDRVHEKAPLRDGEALPIGLGTGRS